MKENKNMPVTISIVNKPFKTDTDKFVQQNYVEFKISDVVLELKLDSNISYEAYKESIKTFAKKLQEKNVNILNYTKEAEKIDMKLITI